MLTFLILTTNVSVSNVRAFNEEVNPKWGFFLNNVCLMVSYIILMFTAPGLFCDRSKLFCTVKKGKQINNSTYKR